MQVHKITFYKSASFSNLGGFYILSKLILIFNYFANFFIYII